MQLSIIIINYNTKDLIVQCINSIPIGPGNNDVLSHEIIVVDNASTDGKGIN